MTQALKYKFMLGNRLVTCDGKEHHYHRWDLGRDVTCPCFCGLPEYDSIRWHPTFAAANAARIEAKYGQ